MFQCGIRRIEACSYVMLRLGHCVKLQFGTIRKEGCYLSCFRLGYYFMLQCVTRRNEVYWCFSTVPCYNVLSEKKQHITIIVMCYDSVMCVLRDYYLITQNYFYLLSSSNTISTMFIFFVV